MKQTTAKHYIVKSELLDEEWKGEGYAMLYGEFSVLANGKESVVVVDPETGDEYAEIIGEVGAFVPAKKFKAVDVYLGRGDNSIESIDEYIHESAEVVAKSVHDSDKAQMEIAYADAEAWVIEKELEFYHMEERYGVWFVQTGEERDYIILPEDHEWYDKVEAINEGSATDEEFAAWDNFVENMWT